MSTPNQSVALIIQNSLNEYLMQLRDDKEGLRYRGMWGTVGGGILKTESLIKSVERELKEETGLEKINLRIQYLTKKIDLYQNHKPLLINFFYCRVPSIKKIECYEGQMFKYFKKKEVLKLNIPKIVYDVINTLN